tara:strand:+ start:3331 stop:4053 length:723 start_codon:yes stop_codon:yes gene_type:complete
MSIFDHLEELRQRIIKSIIVVCTSIILSFLFIKPLVSFLEIPAKSITLVQLSPGEFLFVSLKIAGYSGLIFSLPYIISQIIFFISPGLTNKEKKLILPATLGSGVLFFVGLFFSWWVLIPAAINFFIRFGEDVVQSAWSIERYFDFVLLLMSSTALAFQLPVLQFILGTLGIITAEKMTNNWRPVVIFAAILSAILTPSTDPLTMTLLTISLIILFFIGILLIKTSKILFKVETPSSFHQ